MYRILIIDDHPIVAEGISRLISSDSNNVCTCIDNVSQIREIADKDAFDLCITDLELKNENGFSAIEYITDNMPKCKILIYTMHEEPWVIAKLSEYKINGAVSKNDRIKDVTTAIHEIKNGKKYFSESFSGLLKVSSLIMPYSKVPELSKREIEVLTLISKGLNTPEISEILFISQNTVQTYRKRLLDKFEAKNVAELVCKWKDMF